jgi:MoxR-like ATPase
MTWKPCYRGNGLPQKDVKLPPPPPWRTFPRSPDSQKFRPPEGLPDAVNAALCLRRPLLITGAPGSGKSTVIEQVAAELQLGTVLRWHITSRSTLAEALYRYDALGRIYAQRRKSIKGDLDTNDDIAPFLQLGPLGTALLPGARPRALLIDEIDKSDLDLPGDLLDVLERGEFEIPELIREDQDEVVLRTWKSDQSHKVIGGRVQCTEFPFIVMTSNGEQELAAPFLRRCVRYSMPLPTVEMLRNVIRNWLKVEVPDKGQLTDLVDGFVQRLQAGESIAIDQLLNTVNLIHGEQVPESPQRERLVEMLMRDLSRA